MGTKVEATRGERWHSLISRRALDVVDHDDFDGAFAGV
jgi:hypothetical protein